MIVKTQSINETNKLLEYNTIIDMDWYCHTRKIQDIKN